MRSPFKKEKISVEKGVFFTSGDFEAAGDGFASVPENNDSNVDDKEGEDRS